MHQAIEYLQLHVGRRTKLAKQFRKGKKKKKNGQGRNRRHANKPTNHQQSLDLSSGRSVVRMYTQYLPQLGNTTVQLHLGSYSYSYSYSYSLGT